MTDSPNLMLAKISRYTVLCTLYVQREGVFFAKFNFVVCECGPPNCQTFGYTVHVHVLSSYCGVVVIRVYVCHVYNMYSEE